MLKTALVLGAGGFIGSHLVKKLKSLGYWVRGVDLKYPEFETTIADEFIIGDLTDLGIVSRVMFSPLQGRMMDNNAFDEVYQLAALMGGAGFIFTKEHDADIIHNSAIINLNVAQVSIKFGIKKLFFSSSACIYPEEIQTDPNNPGLKETDAYPANPDSEYGWEKLFSEHVYKSYARNYGLDVRIGRFHNIFGEQSCYNNGKEKFPAAVCRKVAEAMDGDIIEIWGTGNQTRSFLYINECVEGVLKLMDSDYKEPINIGSDEMITINDLTHMVIDMSGKKLSIKNITGPTGVMGRNSDNTLIKEKLNWTPSQPLRVGMEILYNWINKETNNQK